MGAHFIQDLRDGQSVQRTFGVREGTLSTDRHGGSFIRLTLCDRTGTITARKWNASDLEWNALKGAHFVRLRGTVETFQGQLQIIAAQIEPADAPERITDFVPETPGDRRNHRLLLKGLVDSIREPNLRALMLRLFSDPEFRDLYYNAPGARMMHHAYVGGLLEHSLEVASLCLAVCEKVPSLKRDLLLVGALLHDLGKTRETELDVVSFETSLEGGLVGHVVMGVTLVSRALDALPDVPPSLRAAVLHLLVSHHGTRDWGAPISPAFAEAYVLHFCDQISSKLALCREGAEQSSTGLFTRARGLEGHLYLGEIAYDPSIPHLADGDGREISEDLDRIFLPDMAPGEIPERPVLRIVAGGLEEAEILPEMIALPIVGHIAAGRPIDAEEHVEGYRALALGSITGVKDFLLRVTGDSMRDAHILDGDLVRVRPHTDAREGDIIAALVNGDVTVKRFHRANDAVILHPENKDYPDIRIHESDTFAVQGVVVGLLREYMA